MADAAKFKYAFVFLASLAILLPGISTSPMMFDESAYVGAARNFNAGTPSVNPEHPPLAKYLIAQSIKTFGDVPFGWRFPSAIAGALLALCLFGLSFVLANNWHTAYVAWLLTIANIFWYVMSRVAMLAIFELAFEAAAAWTFTIALQAKENETRWFAWSGALFGLSIGCRWIGAVGFIVCIAYALVYHRPLLKAASVMIGTAAAVYVASWVPLIVREHRAVSYLVSANTFIFEFHRHARGDPRLGQMWWSWIFRSQAQPSLSYLVGNPLIAVVGLVALAVLLWKKQFLLPALYVAHMLQWAIALKPMTFYYYYFEAFTWLTVALAVAMRGIVIRRVRLDVIVTACAFAVFAHWYISYIRL